jgi:thymidylate synthase
METKHSEYQYLDLLKKILDHGDRKVDRGTGDASYSLFGAQMRFDLAKDFPLLTTKKVFWKGVVEELYWFTSGSSNVADLARKGVHIWDDYPYKIYNKKNPGKLTKDEFVQKLIDDDAFAKENGELPRIYGELWRRWPTKTAGRTIDQLAWAIQELKDDPNAHNLIVNSWNPEYLYTMGEYEDASRFPICHNMYQFDLIDGKLNLQLYQRSADMFLGVPFNIASYALLTIILAKVTGYEPGEFVHTLGDYHIYENHREQVREQLNRTPKPFPRIEVDKSIKNIDDFTPDKVKLVDYDPHPSLKAELSVSGGFFEKKL